MPAEVDAVVDLLDGSVRFHEERWPSDFGQSPQDD
jgi:hypothetical protein